MPYLRATAAILTPIMALVPSDCPATDGPQGKPNILLIIADEMASRNVNRDLFEDAETSRFTQCRTDLKT